MKVITEEKAILARNALLKKGNNLGACAIDMLITDHAEELDTLTVSKLRPMCEAPKCKEYILVHFIGGDVLRESYYDDGFYIVDGYRISEKNLDGWIPLIVIKPEEMIWPDACG